MTRYNLIRLLPVTLVLLAAASPSRASIPILITGGSATGMVNTPFSYTIQVNGPFIVQYSISGTLPLGLTLNTTTGVIGGTPSQSGVYSVTIGATFFEETFTAGLVITIAPAPPPLVLTLTSSANPSTLGQTVTFTASITGGLGTLAGTVQFLDGNTLLGSASVSNAQAAFTTAALTAGSHGIYATYDGAAQAIGQVVNLMASTTTLTAPASAVFGQVVAITAQVTSTPPMGFAAPTGQVLFEDGGKAIGTATLTSGAATFSSITLALGTHPITAVYLGDSIWGSSHASATVTITQPPLRLISVASGASTNFSPGEAVGAFNVSGLSGDTSGALPLSITLAGVTVTITDSAGKANQGLIYAAFASASQVNFVVPDTTAPGAATVTIMVPQGPSLSAPMNITTTAPGMFAANMNGQGVFAGQVVYVHADNSRTVVNSATFVASSNTFVANAIDLSSATDQVFLQMYGTGFRHAAIVTAAINGVSVPAVFAAVAGDPGLDQVNLQLPGSLAGAGSVDITISADGQTANTVTATIQ